MKSIIYEASCSSSLLVASPSIVSASLSLLYLHSFLILMPWHSSLLLCSAVRTIVNECDPLAVHDIGCHTEQQIKSTMLHIFPFLIPHSLHHFNFPLLNYPSPLWSAQLSCAPYTNEQSLYARLLVDCISLWIFFPPLPHFSTESLYGDVTDKPLLDCCACGTAKYRVTFYGNWSEKIHPKDYPRKNTPLLIFIIQELTPQVRKMLWVGGLTLKSKLQL